MFRRSEQLRIEFYPRLPCFLMPRAHWIEGLKHVALTLAPSAEIGQWGLALLTLWPSKRNFKGVTFKVTIVIFVAGFLRLTPSASISCPTNENPVTGSERILDTPYFRCFIV